MQADVIELAEQLGALLAAKNYRVTTAESCTGGGVAQAITAIPGSSAWFEYGFVTYSNQAKTKLLGVDQACLDAHGAVSREVVIQMAAGALREGSADLAVAVSGIAGPDGGSEDKPAGTVWFAWAERDGDLKTVVKLLDGDRAEVRHQSVKVALIGLIDAANRKN